MGNIKRRILNVDGMTCSNCELKIEKSVNKLEGVKESKAVYSSSKVYVTFDEDLMEINEVINAVERAGYKASYGKADSSGIKMENKKSNKNNRSEAGQIIVLVVILLSLYAIISNRVEFGFISRVDQSMIYVVLIFVGLLMSLSVNKEVNIMKSLKKIINDFLKKIADQNQMQFGKEKLDCCKLDRPKQNSK